VPVKTGHANVSYLNSVRRQSGALQGRLWVSHRPLRGPSSSGRSLWRAAVADRPKSAARYRLFAAEKRTAMIGIAQVARLFVTCYVIRHDPHCYGKLAHNT
jgi:hypothetical protein